MSGEVMLPPWVRPESPETIRWIDDATTAFSPAFGRGMTQRGIWADPRWGLRRRYRGLRTDEKAAILNALSETRGQVNILRVTPHAPIRGSFATSEATANGTFASGVASWSTGGGAAMTVSDRTARVSYTAGSNDTRIMQTVTGVAFAPYVARAFVRAGSSPGTLRVQLSDGTITLFSSIVTGAGIAQASIVPITTTPQILIGDYAATGGVAGQYFSVGYASVARCALVDNAPNLLQQSNGFGVSPWTVATGVATAANGTTGPDLTVSAQYLQESDTTSREHYVQQTVTVSSDALDYTGAVSVDGTVRSWVLLRLAEFTGSTVASAWFNVATGVIGTVSSGANWADARATITDQGSGWFRCTITARKTNAATSIALRIQSATGDTNTTYAGTGGSVALLLWHSSLAQSSVAVRDALTTSSASSGTTQTGGALWTKGWPASTSGLLLTGDWFEINGELKQLTAPVNSNAAGLAYLQFRPGLAGSAADSDPVIVFEPFGRFIYPGGTRELENLFGIYGDCEMNLEEIYS